MIDTIWDVNSADMPYVQVVNYINQLDFLKEPYKSKYPKKEYSVNGVIFRPVLDLSKVTTAQYVDFQTLLQAKDYKRLLNCLFIKDGETYGESDNSDFLWENLTLDVYSDVLFFFRKLLTTLTTSTLRSSIKMMRKLVKKERDKTRRIALLRKMVQVQQALLQVDEDEQFE